MENTRLFNVGDRVRLEYEVDSRFFKDDKIYYTLKNIQTGTYLKGCAFTSDELIPVPKEDENSGV